MAKFYFDLIGDKAVFDNHGVNLKNIDAARDYAVTFARELMATKPSFSGGMVDMQRPDLQRQDGAGAHHPVQRTASGAEDVIARFARRGNDLRRAPIEQRKAALAELARNAKPGLQLSQHLERPGDIVFAHACKRGLEGIVSKRRGSRYHPAGRRIG